VPDAIDASFIKEFSAFAKDVHKRHDLLIVTGGGKTARKYISPAREFGASEVFCDLIGIDATRLNARLLISALGKEACPEPPINLFQAARALELKKIVVMGGTDPGHSTDAVAALLAEYVDADLFINASNVPGVYDKDPNRSTGAKMFGEISSTGLIDLIKPESFGAGRYALVDLMAAKVIQRSGIKTIFLKGKDLKNMKDAIDGKKFIGTTIKK